MHGNCDQIVERSYTRKFEQHEVNADWREHMKADIHALTECDGILMLRGWEQSKGAKLEFDVATSCGLEVWLMHRYPASLSAKAMQL